jgi:hypothetical protein
MLGAAALVTCGYAVSRLRGNTEIPEAFKPRTPEQEEYMREVRNRNIGGLMYEGRRSHMHKAGPRGEKRTVKNG